MKYPYIVKYNGVYYPAGTEVPDGESDEFIKGGDAKKIVDVPEPAPDPEPENEPEPDTADEQAPAQPEADEPETDEENKTAEPENEPAKDFQPVPKYNKNALNRMPVMELRNVALEVGIKDVANKTGGQLKAELIELFGL